jgi:hypothetical protein
MRGAPQLIEIAQAEVSENAVCLCHSRLLCKERLKWKTVSPVW